MFPLLVISLCQITWADKLHDLQQAVDQTGKAEWGHWGSNPDVFFGSTSHSNRLIPIYTFGVTLEKVRGENSVYRDEEALKQLFGYLPEQTLNPAAEYFDQTDVYRLQQQAVAEGKKYIFLVIFDGMDWELTRAAAHYKKPETLYTEGRGTGLLFLDYQAPVNDFGFFVTTPTNSKADVDVNTQTVINPATGIRGGYDPLLGGATPWAAKVDLPYLLGKNNLRPHAVADSACTAAAMTTGKKSYNGAINFDSLGRQSEPIAVQLQRKGWKVGAVTSVPIPHATPGCAYANNVSRSDYQDISRDMLGLQSSAHPGEPLPGLDVVIGAGWGNNAPKASAQGNNFESGNLYVPDSAIREIDAKQGGKYYVVQRTAGQNGTSLLEAAAGAAVKQNLRLFGFFGARDGNLPFATADGKFDPVLPLPASEGTAPVARRPFSVSSAYTAEDLNENPTLADMTRAALKVLSANKQDSFWLMVEPGDVDWAAHNDDLNNVVGAIYSGDAAFQVVTEWIEKNDAWDDSVVIVTADHGHLFVPTKLEMIEP